MANSALFCNEMRRGCNQENNFSEAAFAWGLFKYRNTHGNRKQKGTPPCVKQTWSAQFVAAYFATFGIGLNVCVYVYTFINVDANTGIHTRIHTCMHTYVHTWHTNMHTYKFTYIGTRMHTYIRMYIHAYTHTCPHNHRYIHMHVYYVGGSYRIGRRLSMSTTLWDFHGKPPSGSWSSGSYSRTLRHYGGELIRTPTNTSRGAPYNHDVESYVHP